MVTGTLIRSHISKSRSRIQRRDVTESWRKRQLITHIRDRQAERIGHVTRGDTLLKDIPEGRIKGKKQSGRPRCITLDWMMNRDDGYAYENLKEMAQCRRTWKIGKVCAMYGPYRTVL